MLLLCALLGVHASLTRKVVLPALPSGRHLILRERDDSKFDADAEFLADLLPVGGSAEAPDKAPAAPPPPDGSPRVAGAAVR